MSDRFTAAQAVVLVLATLWDVAMSGENVTNVKGKHNPAMPGCWSTSATRRWWSPPSSTSRPASASPGTAPSPPLIENDALAQNGLLFLGLPLLITFFFLNLGAWLRRQRGPEVETVDRTEITG
ncbi:MAG TPA: hypothetical protein VIA06_09125 [Candidatus Dormibacteraeota bacterium]|nr:hypothetical protein [Candidatus Dormibacteraeota bacterium]